MNGKAKTQVHVCTCFERELFIRASSKTRVKCNLDNFLSRKIYKTSSTLFFKKTCKKDQSKKGVHLQNMGVLLQSPPTFFSIGTPPLYPPERNFSSMMIREKIVALSLPHIFSFRKKILNLRLPLGHTLELRGGNLFLLSLLSARPTDGEIWPHCGRRRRPTSEKTSRNPHLILPYNIQFYFKIKKPKKSIVHSSQTLDIYVGIGCIFKIKTLILCRILANPNFGNDPLLSKTDTEKQKMTPQQKKMGGRGVKCASAGNRQSFVFHVIFQCCTERRGRSPVDCRGAKKRRMPLIRKRKRKNPSISHLVVRSAVLNPGQAVFKGWFLRPI